MSQLLLKTLGHPWCHVPTENPCYQRPCLSAFTISVPVTVGVLSSAPGNAPAVCRCVDRCGGALVSCLGLAGGCGRNGILPLCPAQESVKMTRMVVESCHPRPGYGARRDKAGSSIRRNRRLVLGENKLAGGARYLHHFPPRPPLRHLAHPRIRSHVHCGWGGHGHGRVRVPAGWHGRGRGHICEDVCNQVCLPRGL